MLVVASLHNGPPQEPVASPPRVIYADRVGLLDIDAFFAAAEVLRRPDLAHRPLVVAYDHPRAVVSTASYEARVFGVRSGEPLARARAAIRDLVVVEPDFAWYQELSLEVFAELASHVDIINPSSLDEAFFPVPAAVSDVPHWLVALRVAVISRTGLSVSIGAGPSRTVAKLAASAAKPGKTRWVSHAEAPEFLAAHRLDALPGVGAAAVATLDALGCASVADLAALPPGRLPPPLAATLGQLLDLEEPQRFTFPSAPKSVSVVSTFPEDVSSFPALLGEFERMLVELDARLSLVADAASTGTVRLRSPDFSDVSKSKTLSVPVCGLDDLRGLLYPSLEALAASNGSSWRLLALSVSNFSLVYPSSLFEETSAPRPHRWVAGASCHHSILGPGAVVLVAPPWLLVRTLDRRVRLLDPASVSATPPVAADRLHQGTNPGKASR